MATTYSVVGTSVTRDEGPDKVSGGAKYPADVVVPGTLSGRSEEHTSELQSRTNLVCRLLLEQKNKQKKQFL